MNTNMNTFIKVMVPCPFTLFKSGLQTEVYIKEINAKISKELQIYNETQEKKEDIFATYTYEDAMHRLQLKEHQQNLYVLNCKLKQYNEDLFIIKQYLRIYFLSYKSILNEQEMIRLMDFIM